MPKAVEAVASCRGRADESRRDHSRPVPVKPKWDGPLPPPDDGAGADLV